MVWNDPIVDEIHQIREAIMREHDNDLHKLFESLRKQQQMTDRVVVTEPLHRGIAKQSKTPT